MSAGADMRSAPVLRTRTKRRRNVVNYSMLLGVDREADLEAEAELKGLTVSEAIRAAVDLWLGQVGGNRAIFASRKEDLHGKESATGKVQDR
jgi:hypothetical protein